MLEPSESDKLFATLEADPNDALALGMLIDCLEDEGKPDAAEYFRQAQKASPGGRAQIIRGVLDSFLRTTVTVTARNISTMRDPRYIVQPPRTYK